MDADDKPRLLAGEARVRAEPTTVRSGGQRRSENPYQRAKYLESRRRVIAGRSIPFRRPAGPASPQGARLL
ncbi:hypothetical protein HDC93_006168 [Streptomyces sp. AK010]|nr:hypothetical protein [Streptomyces sp. AK010]